jgi:hypothetical protein
VGIQCVDCAPSAPPRPTLYRAQSPFWYPERFETSQRAILCTSRYHYFRASQLMLQRCRARPQGPVSGLLKSLSELRPSSWSAVSASGLSRRQVLVLRFTQALHTRAQRRCWPRGQKCMLRAMISTFIVPSYRRYRPQTIGSSLRLILAPPTASGSAVGMVIYAATVSPRPRPPPRVA